MPLRTMAAWLQVLLRLLSWSSSLGVVREHQACYTFDARLLENNPEGTRERPKRHA